MATKKQVEFVLEHLQASHPAELFRTLDESSIGVGAVLRYLSESTGDVTAGNISEFMQVSTARVAVLLRKMASQGLITKETAADDARITIVRLTSKGEERIHRIHDEMYAQVNEVIDAIGMEKVMDFITISNEIKAAITSTASDGVTPVMIHFIRKTPAPRKMELGSEKYTRETQNDE